MFWWGDARQLTLYVTVCVLRSLVYGLRCAESEVTSVPHVTS